jgi:hypothetical protein
VGELAAPGRLGHRAHDASNPAWQRLLTDGALASSRGDIGEERSLAAGRRLTSRNANMERERQSANQ